MALSTTAKNYMLDQLTTNKIKYMGLLNDSQVEISGGTPAYARKAVTFGAATGGVATATSIPTDFDVPAGVTVSYVQYYDALTAGNTFGPYDVTNEAFAAQGLYRVSSLVISYT